MNCNMCNKELNAFNKYKSSDGCICKKCHKMLPFFIRYQNQNMLTLKVICLIDYFNENNKMKFDTTASLGNIKIDEINGVFAIKEGNVLYKFYCLDMKEGEFVCTNVKADKYNNVFCDIEFRCMMDNPIMNFKVKIKKNVKCRKQNVSAKNIEWTEPSELSMFRNLFNSMIKKQIDKYSKKAKETIIKKSDIEYLRAKALYMVEDDYTLEEIKSTKKQLLKTFHPDEQNGDNTKSKIILKYYEILKDTKNEEIK